MASVLWAEWRRGLKDLQNAALNPWNGITQSHEEAGTIANPTQQIVTEDIRGESEPHKLLSPLLNRAVGEKQQQAER